MDIHRLIWRGDFFFTVQQVMQTFDSKDPKMAACCFVIRHLDWNFDGIELRHIMRSDNVETNALAKMGTTREQVSPDMFLEHLHKPSMNIESKIETKHPPVDVEATKPWTTISAAANPEAEEAIPAEVLIVIPRCT